MAYVSRITLILAFLVPAILSGVAGLQSQNNSQPTTAQETSTVKRAFAMALKAKGRDFSDLTRSASGSTAQCASIHAHCCATLPVIGRYFEADGTRTERGIKSARKGTRGRASRRERVWHEV